MDQSTSSLSSALAGSPIPVKKVSAARPPRRSSGESIEVMRMLVQVVWDCFAFEHVSASS